MSEALSMKVEAEDADTLDKATILTLSITGPRDTITDIAELVLLSTGSVVDRAVAYSSDGTEQEDVTESFQLPSIPVIDPLETGDTTE